jgi:hypothetical protein
MVSESFEFVEEALVNLFFLGLGIGYVHSIAADM